MSKFNIDEMSSGKSHLSGKIYVPEDLESCEKVWMRVDRVKKSLEAPYTGSYRVLKRAAKHFVVELPNDVKYTVSIDRLKQPFVKISQRRLSLDESKDASDSQAENKNSSKDNE